MDVERMMRAFSKGHHIGGLSEKTSLVALASLAVTKRQMQAFLLLEATAS